jgi:hypothetical protein
MQSFKEMHNRSTFKFLNPENAPGSLAHDDSGFPTVQVVLILPNHAAAISATLKTWT